MFCGYVECAFMVWMFVTCTFHQVNSHQNNDSWISERAAKSVNQSISDKLSRVQRSVVQQSTGHLDQMSPVERDQVSGSRSGLSAAGDYEYYYDDYYYYTDDDMVSDNDTGFAAQASSYQHQVRAPPHHQLASSHQLHPAINSQQLHSDITKLHPSTTTLHPSTTTLHHSIITLHPSITTLHPSTTKLQSGTSTVRLGTSTLQPVQLSSGSSWQQLRTSTVLVTRRDTSLRVTVIPVVRGLDTSRLTITQTYHVSRTASAVITVLPTDNRLAEQLMDADLTSSCPSQLHQQVTPSLHEHQEPLHHPHHQLQPFGSLNNQLQPFGSLNNQLQPGSMFNQPTPALQQQQQQQQLMGHLAIMELLKPYMAAAGALPAQNVAAASPAHTVVNTSPVYISTTFTTTYSTPILVTFFAKPTTEYITSTSVVSTVITSYVISTTVLPRQSLFG